MYATSISGHRRPGKPVAVPEQQGSSPFRHLSKLNLPSHVPSLSISLHPCPSPQWVPPPLHPPLLCFPTPASLSLACTRARKDFLTGPGLPAIESRAFHRSAPNRWTVLPGVYRSKVAELKVADPSPLSAQADCPNRLQAVLRSHCFQC